MLAGPGELWFEPSQNGAIQAWQQQHGLERNHLPDYWLELKVQQERASTF